MSFFIRELREEDLSNGFIETLSNLSEVGELAKDTTRKREILSEIKDKNYRIVIAEDNHNHQIIGSATLLIEQKFIHNGGKAGHIEDVVTRKGYEGKGIGREILKELIKIAKDNECYKIILDCDEKLVKFYEKIGFKKHSIMMRLNT
ncbi:MAG: GNAT family N-acetyltransferase [Candidatus Nitrosocosmicus sp.]